MLVKDLIAQGTLHKTVDLLEAMMDATEPKKRRDDIRVRAYVVGSFWRKRPRKLRLVTAVEKKARVALKREADRILKSA